MIYDEMGEIRRREREASLKVFTLVMAFVFIAGLFSVYGVWHAATALVHCVREAVR